MPKKKEPHIVVKEMTLAYGSNVVQRNVSFTVNRGDVFIIMGGSGCGKSTTMRGLTGLKPPSAGEILYDGIDFYGSTGAMNRIRRNLGVMFQSGALWSSMTLAENVALPLEQYTSLKAIQIGKARFRTVDLVQLLRECGADALPIVSMISLLVSLILAFVGAIQLQMFGAQIYVANLVGVAMVRVLGPLDLDERCFPQVRP